MKKVIFLMMMFLAIAGNAFAVCTWPGPWMPMMTFGDPLTLAVTPVGITFNSTDKYVAMTGKVVGTSNGRLELYRSGTCNDYILDATWSDADGTRKNYAGAVASDVDNNIWLAGWTTASDGSNPRLVLRKRTSAGVWTTITSTQTFGSGVGLKVTGMVARKSGVDYEVVIQAAVTETGGNWSWSLIRYISTSGGSFSRYTKNVYSSTVVYPDFIKLDSNGKMWIGGGQADTTGKVHGIVQKEGANIGTFTTVVNYQTSTAYNSEDRFRDMLWGSTTSYFVSNYKPSASGPVLSKIFSAPTATPSTLTTIESGWTKDSNASSSTTYTHINSSYGFWVGGFATEASTSNTRYTFVRKAATGAGPYSTHLIDKHFKPLAPLTGPEYLPSDPSPLFHYSASLGITMVEGTSNGTDARAALKTLSCN